MEKFFWFSLPITLLIVYLICRALLGNPVARRDTNMIFSIYLLFYVIITAALGLFWVARMDLPAFDLHYLFGYCLIFLVCIHLWFQMPLVNLWLKKKSPSILVNAEVNQWRFIVKYSFLSIVGCLMFGITTIIVYEYIRPATITVIEKIPETPITNQRLLHYKGRTIAATDYMHQQGNITRNNSFIPRFNIAKPPIFKEYPNAPIITLPVPSQHAGLTLEQALSQHSGSVIPVLDLQRLSNLLFYSYGVTETRHYPGGQIQLRAAASSGALYPNDIYIAAYAIKGLAQGVYYYHPGKHSLFKVADATVLPELTAATPDPALISDAAAVILIAAYFDRSVWKYEGRAYRYILLDTGHLLANLSLTSAAIHLPLFSTTFFDDKKIEKILDLATENEGVIQLAILGKRNFTSPTQIRPYQSLPLLAADNKLEVTRILHKLTSVQWTTGAKSSRVMADNHHIDDRSGSKALMLLPKRAKTTHDLFALIKRRRSFRQFESANVSLNNFAGVIEDAYQPLKQANHLDANNKIDLYVMVSHVDDIPSGIYRYLPEKVALDKLVDGDFSAEIYQAGLSQEVLQRAAFVLIWVIDLNSIGASLGEREYRDVNIRSGFGSEITYLAAQTRGLGVCAVGAFYDDEVQSILRLSGTSKRAVLFTAVGSG